VRTNLVVSQQAFGFGVRALFAGTVGFDGRRARNAFVDFPSPRERGYAQHQLVPVGFQGHRFVHLRLDVLPGQPVGVHVLERRRVIGQLGRAVGGPEVVHHQSEMVYVFLQSGEVEVHWGGTDIVKKQ